MYGGYSFQRLCSKAGEVLGNRQGSLSLQEGMWADSSVDIQSRIQGYRGTEHHMKAKSDHRAGLASPLIGNVRSFEILVAYHKIKIKQWGFNPQLRTLLYANSL